MKKLTTLLLLLFTLLSCTRVEDDALNYTNLSGQKKDSLNLGNGKYTDDSKGGSYVNNTISIPNPTSPLPIPNPPLPLNGTIDVFVNPYIIASVATLETSIIEDSWTIIKPPEGWEGIAANFSIEFNDDVIYDSNAPILISLNYKSNINTFYRIQVVGDNNESYETTLPSTSDTWQNFNVDIVAFLLNKGINLSNIHGILFGVTYPWTYDGIHNLRVKDVIATYQTEFAGTFGGEDLSQFQWAVGWSCSESTTYNIKIALSEAWHFEKIVAPWIPDVTDPAVLGITINPMSGGVGVTDVSITIPSYSSGLMQYEGIYFFFFQKNTSGELLHTNMSYFPYGIGDIMEVYDNNTNKWVILDLRSFQLDEIGQSVNLRFRHCSGNVWNTARFVIHDYNHPDDVSFDTYNDMINNINWLTVSPASGTSCIDQVFTLTVTPNNDPIGRQGQFDIEIDNSIFKTLNFYQLADPLFLPPSNLVATAVSSAQINLSWSDNSSNESGFKIERSNDGGSTWALIYTSGANYTTYQDTGLTPSTTYHYRVYTYSGTNNSGISNIANATTFASVDLLTGLVGYYALEESSGSVLTQIGSVNGTVYGSPARQQTGKDNSCYLFNGSSAINLGIDAYRFTNDFTISIWFKLTSLATVNELFSRYFSSTGYRCYHLGINTAAQVYFQVYNTSNVATTLTATGYPLTTGSWYHVVFVKIGTTMKIFINNSLANSLSSAPSTIRDQAGSTSNLKTYIGATAKINSSPDLLFHGYIDEVAVWNIGLSDNAVNELWNNGAGKFFGDF